MTWQRDQSLAAERRIRNGVKPLRVGRIARGSVPRRVAKRVAVKFDTVKRESPNQENAGRDNTNRDNANRENEGYLIKELQHRLRTQIESRIRSRGLWLSFPHSVVLMTLREEPGLSGAQLARRNSVTAQTMNGLLMPLESKGLIERRADPENARILKCFLKPKGVSVLEQGMREAAVVFDLMLGKLTTRERDEFRRILRRCIDALQGGGPAHADVMAASARLRAAKRKAHS